MTVGLIWALFGAAMVVALAGIGSGYGCGMVGISASGLISREPDKFGSTIVLQVLPGTQGIFGFLVMYMVINKLGLLTGTPILNIDRTTGILIFAACIPEALLGLFTAFAQGQVAAAAINIIAKAGTVHMTKGLIYAAIVETYSIIGLVSSLLLLQSVRVVTVPAPAPGATTYLLNLLGLG